MIGRSHTCNLTLDDDTVSRQHAELREEDGSWVITDLDSTNGVRVNGWRVPRAVLREGDLVSLGATRLAFRRGGGADEVAVRDRSG